MVRPLLLLRQLNLSLLSLVVSDAIGSGNMAPVEAATISGLRKVCTVCVAFLRGYSKLVDLSPAQHVRQRPAAEVSSDGIGF
jgi:hypothetical protein